MPMIYTLTTPLSGGPLSAPVTVAALEITTVYYASTPQLAPVGAGSLTLTLTETTNGWQEQISYQDASVIAFLETAAPATVPTGATMADAMAAALFGKLSSDGKIPAGTLAYVAPVAATAQA